MRLEGFTQQGASHNEDTYGISEKYGFVLDGATELLNEKVTNMDSDAQWFTHEWKKYLNQHLLNHSLTLLDILKQGVREIDNKFLSLKGADKVMYKPSAALALYRVIDNKLEYFLLGDCTLLIAKKNGEMVHLQPQEIVKIGETNIKHLVNIAKEKNINIIEARPFVNDYLIKTRLTKNTDNGYYILSDSEKAIDKGMYGTLAFDEVKQIIGLSDGFSEIYDTFSVYSPTQFAKRVEQGADLKELYNTLRKLQEEDKNCNLHPRFKVRDDATITVFSV